MDELDFSTSHNNLGQQNQRSYDSISLPLPTFQRNENAFSIIPSTTQNSLNDGYQTNNRLVHNPVNFLFDQREIETQILQNEIHTINNLFQPPNNDNEIQEISQVNVISRNNTALCKSFVLLADCIPKLFEGNLHYGGLSRKELRGLKTEKYKPSKPISCAQRFLSGHSQQGEKISKENTITDLESGLNLSKHQKFIDFFKKKIKLKNSLKEQTNINNSHLDSADCCAVCIAEFVKGVKIRTLKCKHYYHKSCIDKWFVQHRKCPLCMFDAVGRMESILEEIPSPSEDI
ncbi:hypothetical protein HK099_008350 [Clydaea vesicula]|uniref:RING-type domain-containing protein n=1 Tax=Clydaea vesicula TaxID=447962 RepID=A0AAD5TYV7_9FUNG|nr:hypothetical protein HK099_008350 [Clydaea vesicula]